MSDHYETIGVDPTADKDEIRAAYREALDRLAQSDAAPKANAATRDANREQRAALNRAWAVLSDPQQRARYDRSLFDERAGTVDEDVDEGSGELERVPVPPPALEGDDAVRARALDSGTLDGGPLASRSKRRRLELPAGMRFSATQPRLLAMMIDLIVLFMVFNLVQAAAGSIIERRYPEQTARLKELSTQEKQAVKKVNSADDAVKSAQSKVDAAKGQADKADAQDALDQAKATKKQADAKLSDIRDEQSQLRKDLQGATVLTLFAAMIAGLLYLVPSTALTGRTLGMRLRGAKVVRTDGSKVGWGGAAARFVIPVGIVTALFYSSPGMLLGLGCVLWWLWDPNRQGLHDRAARTLVVDAPVRKYRLRK